MRFSTPLSRNADDRRRNETNDGGENEQAAERRHRCLGAWRSDPGGARVLRAGGTRARRDGKEPESGDPLERCSERDQVLRNHLPRSRCSFPARQRQQGRPSGSRWARARRFLPLGPGRHRGGCSGAAESADSDGIKPGGKALGRTQYGRAASTAIPIGSRRTNR